MYIQQHCILIYKGEGVKNIRRIKQNHGDSGTLFKTLVEFGRSKNQQIDKHTDNLNNRLDSIYMKYYKI